MKGPQIKKSEKKQNHGKLGIPFYFNKTSYNSLESVKMNEERIKRLLLSEKEQLKLIRN